MFTMMNMLILTFVYVAVIAVMLSFQRWSGRDGGDGGNGGDGGWEGPDDSPSIDLPPGVFILPPDEADPSVQGRHIQAKPTMAPGFV